MILIVSDNIGLTIARYRKEAKLSRCRLSGTMRGQSCKVVPRHLLKLNLTGTEVEDIIWDGFEPTSDEKEQANVRRRSAT